MTFDGRQYAGATFVTPQSVSAGAPAVGEALMQAQISAYFASRHRSKMIGNQTYPWRRAHDAPDAAFAASSAVDVAEWPDVWLPEHATHVGLHVYFEHPEGPGEAVAYHQAIVSDGTDTDTGAVFSTSLENTAEEIEILGATVPLFSAFATVELSSITLPIAVSVRLTGYVRDIGGTYNYSHTPRAVTAWRWTA